MRCKAYTVIMLVMLCMLTMAFPAYAETMTPAEIRKYMILLNNDAANDRIKACTELKQRGENAKPLLSFLHMALKRERDPEIAKLMRETIGVIGGNTTTSGDELAITRRKQMQALRGLITQLDDGDALDRRRAIIRIANFKELGLNALPKLKQIAVDDEDELNRKIAQRTITVIESFVNIETQKKADERQAATTQAAQKLIEKENLEEGEAYLFKQLMIYIDDRQPEVRERAAKTLGDMGSKAWEAQSVLQKLALNDGDRRVREAAGEALRKILTSRNDTQSAAEKVTNQKVKDAEFHAQGLLSPLPLTRRESAQKLATLGRHAEKAIPMLQKLINDPYERLAIQRECERAIRAIREDIKQHELKQNPVD